MVRKERKMFHQKNLVIMSVVILTVLMATACSPAATPAPVAKPTQGSATQAPTQAVVTETVQATKAVAFAPGTTLTYIASQNWIKDSEMELAKKFEAETGVHVDFQIIPSDQYFNVLETKLEAGGEGIDIFGGQSGKTDIKVQLNVEKNAVPLTDQEWVKRMDSLSVEQISLDGKTYGLTIWDTIGGSWVTVYNKKIFADHNLSVPKTYAEFASACKTLKDAGITPIYEPFSDGRHHVLWFLELGPVYE